MNPAQDIYYHVVTVGGLLPFKLAVLFVGYLIARLGYDLLIKSVTGEFKFHTEVKGTKADLVSAFPAAFFIQQQNRLLRQRLEHAGPDNNPKPS
jgi:hypothetical protein